MLVSKLAEDPAVRRSQSRHSIAHLLRAGLLSPDPLIAKIFASIVWLIARGICGCSILSTAVIGEA